MASCSAVLTFTMIELPYLTEYAPFPSVHQALNEPNGLLAFGGSLDVTRLFNAYSNGIFPWFSEHEPILWWSPDPRSIIEIWEFRTSRSLAKLVRQARYRISLNHGFEDVVKACASVVRVNPHTGVLSNDTWITEEMQNAYINLHNAGLAHSVEVWENKTLVGGLYGVAVGEVFCGESMFHIKSNTSKLAMYALVQHMRRHGMAFIDCQLPTEHLSSLGAKEVPRGIFIDRLRQHNHTLDSSGKISSAYRQCWQKQDISV